MLEKRVNSPMTNPTATENKSVAALTINEMMEKAEETMLSPNARTDLKTARMDSRIDVNMAGWRWW